ncbi:hypothetical protein VCHA54P489_80144 [Vibrio chagasii]|nr:hypothetical protein VCHA38P215_110042 [Vibrio chagasii]CAH6906921.1 hypothetical protein VCHA54O485_100054 [Vibrio chagasii]CAH6930304.1 hypothetical protein VCHA48P434_110146 [Vibrio chagasii]CAH7041093.1 hypothetical protein VCHA31O73_60060 [Vibrio chagasii]CAH7058777.1 hypothetical protein VCHA35O141_60144 [Vibrio chagasii]
MSLSKLEQVEYCLLALEISLDFSFYGKYGSDFLQKDHYYIHQYYLRVAQYTASPFQEPTVD